MKILFQENGQSGVFYHRQFVPHVAMTKCGEAKVDRTTNILTVPMEELEQYDIVVLHGRIDEKVVSKIRRANCKLVYDVDDYWICTPDRLFYNEWKAIGHAKQIESMIMEADLVTCTSDILHNYIFKHTGKRAEVLPNGISPDDPQFIPETITSHRLRFGFIGGASHTVDMEKVGKAITLLYFNYPELRNYWQIVFGGFDTNYNVYDQYGNKKTFKTNQIPSVNIERNLTHDYRICDVELGKELRKYTPFEKRDTSNDQYVRLWARQPSNYGKMFNEVDVVLAPLRNDTFNRCKSNLKIIEAGWMGKEVIADRVDCFSDAITEHSVVFCDTVNDWLDAFLEDINTFIDNGKIDSTDLQELVKSNYNAEIIAQRRYELYKNLL